MLGGDRKPYKEYSDYIAASRSAGASTLESCSLRRRSISITPEIGDDIVRAVRAMNETLKQSCLFREHGDNRSDPNSPTERNSDLDVRKDVSDFHHDGCDDVSGGRSSYAICMERIGSQRAMSLPSSPHEFRSHTSERSETSDYIGNEGLVSTWNKILESPMFHYKPLLPYEEWNVDFSEINCWHSCWNWVFWGSLLWRLEWNRCCHQGVFGTRSDC